MSLVVDDLKKSFVLSDQHVEVLKSVSFKLSSEERIALIGASGSGKSTLLSLIVGLDRPDGGTVSLDNRNLSQLSENEFAKIRATEFGIVFQNFYLIPHLTALENVMFPSLIAEKNLTKKNAIELLEKVGLGHRLEHRPNQLSGGEKQRVGIARALFLEPKVLIADEPTGNLDEQTAEQIIQVLFASLAETRTSLLLVTHDQSLANRCDRTLRLVHGKVQNAEV